MRVWSATWDLTSPPVRSGFQATLTGLAAGAYQVEYWNTLTGAVTTLQARPNGGTLVLEVASFQRAVAIKVHRAR